VRIAIEVRVEDDSELGDLANSRQAENLESAGIGDVADWVPVYVPMTGSNVGSATAIV